MAKENIYLIHNTTRSPATKGRRMLLTGPEKSTKNLTLGGGVVRVLRGRAQPVSESILLSLLGEIIDKESKGLLYVTGMDSKRVDLGSLEKKSPSTKKAPTPEAASAAEKPSKKSSKKGSKKSSPKAAAKFDDDEPDTKVESKMDVAVSQNVDVGELKNEKG